jgi:hypothetical protein
MSGLKISGCVLSTPKRHSNLRYLTVGPRALSGHSEYKRQSLRSGQNVPPSTTDLDQVRLPLIALVVLSSRCSVMGRFTACRKLIGTAIVTTGAIRAVNVMLVGQSVVS